jgi:hypothetical protein
MESLQDTIFVETDAIIQHINANIYSILNNFIGLFQLTTIIEGIILIIILSTSLISVFCIVNNFKWKNIKYKKLVEEEELSDSEVDAEYDDFESHDDEMELIYPTKKQPNSKRTIKTYRLDKNKTTIK